MWELRKQKASKKIEINEVHNKAGKQVTKMGTTKKASEKIERMLGT